MALCEVSRREFQRVYDALNVKLEEVGESFYNPLIPGIIGYLKEEKGLVELDQGMDIVKVNYHFFNSIIMQNVSNF